MGYNKEIENGGNTHSIDKIRLKFKIKSPKDLEFIMNKIRDNSMYTLDTPYDYEYIERRGCFVFRHNFNIHMKDGKKFYIAFRFRELSRSVFRLNSLVY